MLEKISHKYLSDNFKVFEEVFFNIILLESNKRLINLAN